MSLALTDTVAVLPGVGPARQKQLEEIGILTVRDLLFYAPFRYETVERQIPIIDLMDGMNASFKAKVISKTPIPSRRFRSMLKVRVGDDTGIVDLTWFNAPFMLSSLSVGHEYYFTGKVSTYNHHATLTNPTVEKEQPPQGSLVAVYHESADVTSRQLRRLISTTLSSCQLDEMGNSAISAQNNGFMSLPVALKAIHQPTSETDISQAKTRLGYDEMFTLILGVLERKHEHQQAKSSAGLVATNDTIKEFIKLLPFTPSESQLAAIQAISLDLVQPHPMHRLIQGEVGSGKTAVGAFALYVAATQKPPAILICPTKILASQHFETLKKLFGNKLKIGLFTGKEKMDDADILVGTHALFNKTSLKPSLVIIDEEHRFGVNQREAFFKLKKKPHFLSMTATPIPRTVALTALADRDVSFITPHKPNQNIKTWVTPLAKRNSAYQWIAETLQKTGGQAMIICPFIEESTFETLSSVKSAKTEFVKLTKIFAKHKLALLHGKMKEEEKQAIFTQMMAGKLDILVTTPVVEVGVDIPEANIIVIEGSERYGLAQLHQLRGRVGRRGQEAFCLLFTSSEADATKRLHYFADNYDGNTLAEYDLKHRGSGELLGVRQHGFDTLRFASWFDTKLIELCKEEAAKYLKEKQST